MSALLLVRDDDQPLTEDTVGKWRVRKHEVRGLERIGLLSDSSAAPDAAAVGLSKKSKEAAVQHGERVGKVHWL